MKKKMAVALVVMAVCQLLSINVFAAPPMAILSDAAILMDADSGQILYEKNSHAKMYPASTTKIMTALLAAELSRPYEKVIVSESAVDISEPDSANIALQAGEELTVEDALYALMLPSANDAANVLAEFIAGSQAEFARMMSEKAHEIGAEDTNFVNAHGLHEPGHYTTAYDLALITRYAMGNEDFMQYFGASNYTMPSTNLQPLERPFTNYQSMLVPNTYYYSPDVIGGKVGFTNEAGHTMSTIASKDGRTLVCVVMHSTQRYDKFKDTSMLLNYGFEEFSPITVPKEDLDEMRLPATRDGVPVGNVVFSYDKDVTVLLHNDANPAAVRIRYDHLDSYDLSGELNGSIVLELDGDVPGVPTVLRELPMSSSVNIDVFPESTDVQDSPLAVKDKKMFSGWRVPVFVIPAAAVVLFIIMLAWRNHTLRKRRLARQARLARRARAQAQAAAQTHTMYATSAARVGSSRVRRNVYQARR